MGYSILEDNYYNPPGTGQAYGIRYDPQSGDYVLSQKSAAGYTIGIGLAQLYKNGTWTGDALRLPDLFTDGDPNKPTAKANQLAEDIRRKVNAAHVALGGNAAGLKVHPSAKNPTSQSPATNAFDPSQQPPANIPGTGPNTAPGSNLPGTNGSSSSTGVFGGQVLNFASANETSLFGQAAAEKRLLYYPIDILDNFQDVLKISQFNYQPPSQFTIDGNTKAIDFVTKGVPRKSARKEAVGTVILPIPAGIQDTNMTGWGPSEMNGATAAVAATMLKDINLTATGYGLNAILQNVTGMNVMPVAVFMDIISKGGGLGNLDQMSKDMLTSIVASSASRQAGFEISPEQILARGSGVISNQNMELLFNKVQLREFQFAFQMSPRSAAEGKNVRRIIRFFKQGMAARAVGDQAPLAGKTTSFLGTPNIFGIKYQHYDGKQIIGLNRIKDCALTNMSVQYSDGNMYQSFDDGQPVTVTMALSFTELEPVYENDYRNSVDEDRTDLESIADDEVGY